MPRLPRQYAPYVFGVIQAAITTGIATAIAPYQSNGIADAFFVRWAAAWGLSWLAMPPVVIGVAPIILRTVMAMTTPAQSVPSKTRTI